MIPNQLYRPITGSLILTANVRDFPWPFFHQVENRHIYYKDKNKIQKCFIVSLIRSDIELINFRLKERSK